MPRRGRQSLLETVRVPPPRAGINSVDGAEMAPDECIYCINMIAGEHGMRGRLGFKEYLTGLLGAEDNQIRSMVPFTGSAKNGANDRLFACTSDGIFDVSASGIADGVTYGVKVMDFTYKQQEAGYGSSVIISVPGSGRYLVFCGEENGLYIYSEVTGAWTRAQLQTTQAWAALTNYAVGNRVVASGSEWTCTIAGKSANTAPNGGGPFVDGTATWGLVGAAVAGIGVVGPSLADQNLGFSADPVNFVHVTAWKNRLWFVEKNTSRAWYLDVNVLGGTLNSFDFGPKMRTGGPLVMLVNWSYDAGLGLDTSLVGFSGSGDVVVYVGTDPTSANTFALRGCWTVGAVPYGRRIATEHGGDVLVMSLIGVLPLSKLVISGDTENKSLYETRKISNLFNQLASTKRTVSGWSLVIHPTDNALLITYPSAENNGNTDQLAMSYATRGWSRYRGLPIFSACVWNGELYFGTADGRVCRNVDYLDNVTLVNPNSGTQIEYSFLTSFQNLGNPSEKKVELIRPIILSGEKPAIVSAVAKYDYDLVEPDPATGAPAGGWDGENWDEALWDADYVASAGLQGGTGIGRDVAIAVRGKSSSRTVLAGIDVMFQRGGLL